MPQWFCHEHIVTIGNGIAHKAEGIIAVFNATLAFMFRLIFANVKPAQIPAFAVRSIGPGELT